MATIKITTDSISDIGQENLTKYGIATLPLIITLGDESHFDETDMPSRIYDYVESTQKLPKTAARSVQDYLEFFTANKPDGGELIHFCISQKLSSGYAMATIASQQIDGVHVVDSESLSCGAGLNVLYACDLVNEGKCSGSEIASLCQERAKHSQASFVLDSLEYLHKGGRCNGATKLIASVLKLKPMINLRDGEMFPGKKYRGKYEKAVESYVNDILNQYDTPDLSRVFIAKTTAPDGLVEEVTKQVLAKYNFKEVILVTAGGTITCHCGKNTLGVMYFNDGNK